MRQGKESTTTLESRFANRVQRQALDALIGSMDYKPAALIINGDLTDFGHLHQLHEFRVSFEVKTMKKGVDSSIFRKSGTTIFLFHYCWD